MPRGDGETCTAYVSAIARRCRIDSSVFSCISISVNIEAGYRAARRAAEMRWRDARSAAAASRVRWVRLVFLAGLLSCAVRYDGVLASSKPNPPALAWFGQRRCQLRGARRPDQVRWLRLVFLPTPPRPVSSLVNHPYLPRIAQAWLRLVFSWPSVHDAWMLVRAVLWRRDRPSARDPVPLFGPPIIGARVGGSRSIVASWPPTPTTCPPIAPIAGPVRRRSSRRRDARSSQRGFPPMRPSTIRIPSTIRPWSWSSWRRSDYPSPYLLG